MSPLQIFKTLPVGREVFRQDALPVRAADYARDIVTLGWEERLRSRSRRVSDNGLEFATALPRGVVLRGGDCLVLDETRFVVEVVERDEPVFVVQAASAQEWARFAYHIGNNHQPIMICDDGILCPDVPGMRELLEQHRMTFSRAVRPFTPVGVVPDHRH